MVLPRIAWRRLYEQRLVLLLTMLAFVWPIVCAVFIYLTNHAALLQGLEPEFRQFIQVDGRFFAIFMYVQAGFAVFLAALALLITSYLAAERVRPMWRSDAGSTKRAEATT